ncbi:DAO-domain-containing protein [Ceraceosorus guamensis]|uniref:Glycerol-3-phosphate dehydrogenase n=1 Tax=Ceraceosorus guamensis TaxID=1522189 RepID=A0A316W672_9BASI|nr:DAO-domain-containing protein [Ceraceosorus guamensis]PWN45379.1 DAO-domain-containing protein [Ceraceosorus guamensis]
MLRRPLQTLPRSSGVRFSSSSAGASGPSNGVAGNNSRRALYIAGGAAVLATGFTLSGFGSSIYADQKGVQGDVRPHPLWVPPTRAQMIAALKASSAASLRPQTDRIASDNSSLGVKAAEAKSSAPSPASSEDSKGLAPGRVGDEDGDGFDLLIVGGGATGAGVAVDAATRGLSVALVERDDFGAGTSSKSTKLIHGGVRYLQKAVFELDYDQYKMVKEALHERKTFLHIAPYLSEHLPIMLPVYRWWQIPYYWAGTKMYDVLAGSENMESSYVLGKGKALEAFPMLKATGLAGAVVYYDGQHNDTRMNVALALTAIHHGAVVANHTEVVALHKKQVQGKPDQVCGARMRDLLTGDEWDVKCKGVINATGPFSDALRKMDEPTTQEIVAPSSGVHITLPGYFSPRDMGLIDPQTSDGRVIFFLPWQGNTIAGTTDTAAPVEAHPQPKEEEIQWILDEVRNYLSPDIKVRRGDVLSAWSGLRPLVKDPAAKDTQSLVRNHMINVSASGLLTIAGGKWTTYREMAEQTVDKAIETFTLQPVRGCVTKETRLLGSHGWSKTMYVKLLQRFGLETDVAKHLSATYGDRAWSVCSIAEPTGRRWPVHGKRLDSLYPYIEAEVRYACRSEYAAKAADFIARRSRLSFLNAEATAQALPRIIDLMAEELNWDNKRKEAEYAESLDFLGSMGIQPARVEQLKAISLNDMRKIWEGKTAASISNLSVAALDPRDAEATSVSRASFSSEELTELRKRFSQLDVNADGQVDGRDLKEVLSRLGYKNVSAETITGILGEVDFAKTGTLHFEDFMDVCAALKDARMETAFGNIVREVENGVSFDPIGPSAKENSASRDARRKIPVEKSGGGW